MMYLNKMKPGSAGRISGLAAEAPLLRRFLSLGLCPGLCIRVVRYAPWQDPIEVEINRRHLCLRRDEARCIEVDPR